MKRLVMVLMVFSLNVTAKDLGKRGIDFEIGEKSMLSLIEDRLNMLNSSGEIEDIKADFIKRVKKHINRPNSLNLPRTTETKSYPYYPVVKVAHDIFDTKGNVIVKKDSSVNALTKMPTYFPFWVFIDGEDQAQVEWAKSLINKNINTKIILTGGAIKQVSNKLNIRIYFDQEGRITNKLGITHVPAIVQRKGDALLVTEQSIKGGCDA
jgi:conjugal transfer pilus assembly protein TraW